MRPEPEASVQKNVPASGIPSKLLLGGIFSPGFGPSTESASASVDSGPPTPPMSGDAAVKRAAVQYALSRTASGFGFAKGGDGRGGGGGAANAAGPKPAEASRAAVNTAASRMILVLRTISSPLPGHM
ncbi:hypothetical protein ACGFW5_11885 [Streptomyces sp. NPDC048416]|uniref:hypothetical protein n=1 Tax=Streptomyces sp. NPDC048416 TaxID=3365546 RepID=UPI00371702C8